LIEEGPHSFGHTSTCIDNFVFIYGGFVNELPSDQCVLMTSAYRSQEKPEDYNSVNSLIIPSAYYYLLKVNGEVPAPRERHSASALGNKVYVFGGYNRVTEKRLLGTKLNLVEILLFGVVVTHLVFLMEKFGFLVVELKILMVAGLVTLN
jgi:hypothetical protein